MGGLWWGGGDLGIFSREYLEVFEIAAFGGSYRRGRRAGGVGGYGEVFVV